MARSTVCTFTAVVLCALARDAHAWGSDGHRIVALVATDLLTDDAAEQVGRILGDGTTLQSVANWADEIKYKGGYEWTFGAFGPHPAAAAPSRQTDERCTPSRRCLPRVSTQVCISSTCPTTSVLLDILRLFMSATVLTTPAWRVP